MSEMCSARESMVWVGLDVHQHSVQVCVMDPGGGVLSNRRVANELPELIEAGARYGTPRGIALECSTGSAALADALRQQTGWDVQLCHPGYVRRLRQNPDKTDLSDAQLLADLVRVGYLPQVWLAPAATRDLRTAVRYRQQIVDSLRNVKLRIRALLREHRVPNVPRYLWSVRGQSWLRALRSLPHFAGIVLQNLSMQLHNELARLQAATLLLQEAASQDGLIQALQARPALGLVTACVLRAEIGHFGRFRSGKQLARFCGLSPCNASSGARQADAGLVRGCSRLLRDTVIQAAHRLGRYVQPWRDLRARLISRGKPGSVAAAAVGNRWLRRLFHEARVLERRGSAGLPASPPTVADQGAAQALCRAS